ncbi:MAG: hypothetical protein DDT18_01153 [Actinobacteria bacterium]|nr:hypothetical protein [Actinomycetota bacterium]
MPKGIKKRLKEILYDNYGYERINHPERIEDDILELFEEREKEVLEELKTGWDVKIVSLITESGTKIEGISVVPLSQILNRLEQKLKELEPPEPEEDYEAMGEAEAEARGRYEEEVRAEEEAEAQREYEDNQPPPYPPY